MHARLSWKQWTRLQKALFISFAIHGALLTLRIASPERFDRLFSDAPLDVILVNTRAKAEAPDKAQALAQTQLAGGGELKNGRAASPLPTTAISPTLETCANGWWRTARYFSQLQTPSAFCI